MISSDSHQIGQRDKIPRLFLKSAGLLLLVTGVAKIISATGTDRLLNASDPVFYLPYRMLFLAAGTGECAIAAFCFFSKTTVRTAWLVGCLSICFVFYRAGFSWIGPDKPCPCLGTLTGALHLSPFLADKLMKLVLIYLLIGSFAVLVWAGRYKSIHSSLAADE